MLKAILGKTEKKVDKIMITALLATLQTANAKELSPVTILKSGITLKAESIQTISCKIKSVVVNERTPILFEPEVDELLPEGIQLHSSLIQLRQGCNSRVSVTIVNSSKRDITLSGRLQVGEIHQVTSVTPVQVQEVKFEKEEGKIQVCSTEVRENEEDVATEEVAAEEVAAEEFTAEEELKIIEDQNEKRKQDRLFWDQVEKMDMSMLILEQKNEARKMLWEEREAFALDPNEVGAAGDLELKINTTDEIPVQHRYNNIPRNMLSEVEKPC